MDNSLNATTYNIPVPLTTETLRQIIREETKYLEGIDAARRESLAGLGEEIDRRVTELLAKFYDDSGESQEFCASWTSTLAFTKKALNDLGIAADLHPDVAVDLFKVLLNDP